MKWLLFLIAASLPSYLIRFQIGKLPSTLLEVLILFTFIVWLLGKLRAKEFGAYFKNFPRLWLWVVCLWLAAATISVFVSSDTRAALGIWKAYFVEPILFLFVFVDVIKTRRDLNLIFIGLGLSAIYISLVAIAQGFLGWPIPAPWQEELRVTSIFPYPNAIGLFLGPLVPIFIGQILKKTPGVVLHLRPASTRRLRRGGQTLGVEFIKTIFYVLATLLSIVAIILAKSEGAILGVAAGLFVLGILWSKRTRLATIILSVIVLVTLLSVPITRNYLIEKTTLRDWSGLVRRLTWGETWNMLRDRPILGAGLAGYQTAMTPYHKNTAIEIFLYPHNIFLNFWSELGVLGLATFLSIVILFYVNIPKLKIRNLKLEIPIMASVTTLLVHGLVDVPYLKNDLAIVFWLFIGLSIIVADNIKPV